MRSFIRSFFTKFGATLQPGDDRLDVRLPADLQEFFGQEDLRLVFDPQRVDESSELVTHGGYVLNTIFEFMQQRGVKSVSRLPERYRPSREEILKALVVENAAIEDIRVARSKNVDVVFSFKSTFLSDEKSELIYQIGIDRRGQVFHAESYYTDDVVHSALSSESHKGDIDLTRKELEARFRSCLKYVSRLATEHGQSLQRDILKRLHRNLLRIKGYYGAQIDELHRNQPGYEEKRLHIEREYEHKKTEEIDNHRLRIVLKLINYHIVERTELDVGLDLRSAQKAVLHADIIYDSFAGTVDYGHCPSCQAQMDSIVITDEGAIACPQCLATCASCRKRLSKASMPDSCSVCGISVCRDCLMQCAECGSHLCRDHAGFCSVGHETLCAACSTTCADCNRVLCHDHGFDCHATRKRICHEHRVICRSCRRVFSSSYVSSLGDRRCPSCNNPF